MTSLTTANKEMSRHFFLRQECWKVCSWLLLFDDSFLNCWNTTNVFLHPTMMIDVKNYCFNPIWKSNKYLSFFFLTMFASDLKTQKMLSFLKITSIHISPPLLVRELITDFWNQMLRTEYIAFSSPSDRFELSYLDARWNGYRWLSFKAQLR